MQQAELARNWPCYLLHADFFLGLLFDPEYMDDKFLRNVG
jgi:hypothetical protein